MPEMNHPNGFSLAIARDLAGFSAVAYEPVIRGAGITVIDYKPLDLRVVVARYDDHIEIAFRGTCDLENWILDLDVRKAPLAYGVKVHDGFLRAAEVLLPLLLSELLPPGSDKAKVKPLYITGHSLGGALASLVALFLSREGLRVAAVYTFGSPRVGNAAFREQYDRTPVVGPSADIMETPGAFLGDVSYRVLAEGDLVPYLPGLLDGFRHVGQEILLTPHGIYARPPHWWEVAHSSWRVLAAMNKLDVHCIVKFHGVNQDYLPLLK